MLFFALLSFSLLASEAGRLAPVNDADRVKGFNGFVNKLRTAVAKRDPKALKRLTDDDVVIGGFTPKDEVGWPAFSRHWEVDKRDGLVWSTLEDFLELGFFRVSPETIVSPYVVWKFPRDLDPRRHLVVLRDGLPLRARPEREAPVLSKLSFDIVRKIGRTPPEDGMVWAEVETLTGIRGFVPGIYVRSPLMARVQFGFRLGQWVIVALDKGTD